MHGSYRIDGDYFCLALSPFLHHDVAGQHDADLVFGLEGLIGKVWVTGAENRIGPKVYVELLFEGVFDVNLCQHTEAFLFEQRGDFHDGLAEGEFNGLREIVGAHLFRKVVGFGVGSERTVLGRRPRVSGKHLHLPG